MRVDTMGRHHINANNVVKLLHKGVILQITSEHTRGRYNTITNATSVVKLSLQGVNLQSMCGHTLGRCYTNAISFYLKNIIKINKNSNLGIEKIKRLN